MELSLMLREKFGEKMQENRHGRGISSYPHALLLLLFMYIISFHIIDEMNERLARLFSTLSDFIIGKERTVRFPAGHACPLGITG